MPSFDLSPVEARILGCLLEKERTVPENYPLSLNALIAACNQTTNREPVTAFDEKTVEAGIGGLREKRLITVVFGAGTRVQKYRHTLPDHFNLTRQDLAVICVLLLRGPQTAGELRSRTERLFHFASIEELEKTLAELQAGDSPLIRLLPQQPGQKERRYVDLFSPEPENIPRQSFPVPARSPEPSRVETLEREIAGLKEELAELRQRFADFERQFQ